MEANLASFVELRNSLLRNGKRLDEIPLVIQHNKRDAADYIALEELHRRLALPKTPIFEGIANQGTGILEPLTTISKQVIRLIRGRAEAPTVTTEEIPTSPIDTTAEEATGIMDAPPGTHPASEVIKEPTRIQEEDIDDGPEKTTSLRLVLVGQTEAEGDGALRIPLTLADSSGKLFELTLKLDIGSWAEVEPR